jgi:hypothetical protein
MARGINAQDMEQIVKDLAKSVEGKNVNTKVAEILSKALPLVASD